MHSKKQNIKEGKQICLSAKENNWHPWFAPSGAIFFPRLWCDFQKHVPYILARYNYKTLNILYYILTINFVYIVIFLMTLIYSYVSNKNLYKINILQLQKGQKILWNICDIRFTTRSYSGFFGLSGILRLFVRFCEKPIVSNLGKMKW